MAKLDRLGWAAATCFEAYGVRFGVRASDPAWLEALPAHLPPGWRPTASSMVDHLYSVKLGTQPRPGLRTYHLLYSGVRLLVRTMDLAALEEALEGDIRQRIAAQARRRIFVHAGVVAWRGRAILIPGRSGSGKTTLVRELLRSGADYYSDEFAVLDDRGRVHPFAKPLSIKGNGITKARPEELGASSGTKPLTIALVAFARYRQGARWRPTRLTAGQGLLAMLAHTVPVRRRPEAALCALERAMARAVILKSARGEAEHTAPSILNVLNR